LVKEERSQGTQPPTLRLSNKNIGLSLLAVLIGALAMVTFSRLGDSAHIIADSDPIPFTSTTGFAEGPAFSPDGNQIAYSLNPAGGMNASIYTKLVGTDTTLQLTYPPGSDTAPTWSPDGRYIAFYRNLPGHSGYYLVSPLGGGIRELFRAEFANNALGESLGSISWFPDGKHAAIVIPAPRRDAQVPANVWSSRRIVRLNIETGEQTPLTSFAAGKLGSELAVSPDGKWLAFIHAPDNSPDEIFLLSLVRSDRPRRLSGFGAYYKGLAWTANSRELIFAMELNGRQRLWRLPIDGREAHPITSSLEALSSPAVASRGHRLAYVVYSGASSLWRIPTSHINTSKNGAAERVIFSTGNNNSPSYSPDGNQIAFVSNRAGAQEIWLSDSSGDNPRQVTNSTGAEKGTPRWSPDGSAVVFDCETKGNREIAVVDIGRRQIRQITYNSREDAMPSWSHDGRWIYFTSDRSGRFEIYKVSASAGESPSTPPTRITTGGGFNPIESPDGRYLYFAKNRESGGLWRCALGRSGIEAEESVLPSIKNYGWWTVGPDGIYFLEREDERPNAKVHLKLLGIPSHQILDLKILPYPILNPCFAALTIAPDKQHVIVEQNENWNSNIVLIENFL
jgi:Tol biopolymer transport system component